MRLFQKSKDGGPESKVTGYFLCEFKSLFSVVLLRFDDGSRDAYHNHAFSAVSWVLRGRLMEYERVSQILDEAVDYCSLYLPHVLPSWTPRRRFHRVVSTGTTWVLSFRGPWSKFWKEYIPAIGETITLTAGRKEI